MRRPIQGLLIEQDYCGRIQFGMTITSRAKADCWKMGRDIGYHSQVGRATKPKVTEALREMIVISAANYDEYEPTHGAITILGQDQVDALVSEGKAVRIAAGY